MAHTLMVLNTVNTQLGRAFSGRKLFVDGISLEDVSQSLDRHRILDNGFPYSCHRHRKIWCLCEQPSSASPSSSTVTQMTPSSTS
ncbi:hypothetical protein MVEG_07247 [Podila verticillata NRRL 6337]|nr:hypothetical protein MVEG_07247 [Podila verticillata NRRL 6337]